MLPMWIYRQATGELLSPEGEVVARGYSGHGEGLNNPAFERVPNVGPIPRGKWAIGTRRTSDLVGAYVLPLTPFFSTKTYGRSAFLIHGDNRKGDQSASRGCIILDRKTRGLINNHTGDRIIEVV